MLVYEQPTWQLRLAPHWLQVYFQPTVAYRVSLEWIKDYFIDANAASAHGKNI
jgi:hypothetical protein